MSAATHTSADDRTPRDAGVRDLSDREVRALTEPLVVVADRGEVRGAPGLAHVYSRAGDRYLVDVRDGVCQCPDSTHRDVTCKHVYAARFWLGQREIPAFVDESAVDQNTLRAAREASEQ